MSAFFILLLHLRCILKCNLIYKENIFFMKNEQITYKIAYKVYITTKQVGTIVKNNDRWQYIPFGAESENKDTYDTLNQLKAILQLPTNSKICHDIDVYLGKKHVGTIKECVDGYAYKPKGGEIEPSYNTLNECKLSLE